MNPDVDNEIEAIKVVLAALQPLAPEVREVVLDYVLKRLGMKAHNLPEGHTAVAEKKSTALERGEQLQTMTGASTPIHIKDLKEEKQPKSAIEMAVLVAYYLSHVITDPDRKGTVSAKDLDTYFKIADFKLPAKQESNLQNAKNAGYFDAVGSGEYKLNPVGYNLAVHTLPRTGKSGTTRRTSKASKKKAASNKKGVTKKTSGKSNDH